MAAAALLGVADLATFGRMSHEEQLVCLAVTAEAWALDAKRRDDIACRMANKVAELLAKAFG